MWELTLWSVKLQQIPNGMHRFLPEFHPNTGQAQNFFWTAVMCNQKRLLFVMEWLLLENLFASDSQPHPDTIVHSAQKAIQA